MLEQEFEDRHLIIRSYEGLDRLKRLGEDLPQWKGQADKVAEQLRAQIKEATERLTNTNEEKRAFVLIELDYLKKGIMTPTAMGESEKQQ